jgi:hypothetical protein
LTRLELLRGLMAKPRDHADQGKIGRRVLWARSDGREKLNHCVRVLKSFMRRAS